MAIDVHYEVAGKRVLAKMPEFMPRIGETILLTPFGRVRAQRYTVARIEWSVAQEESPTYFNRPKQCVLFLEPEGDAADEE
ncbi:MAG: hypothetical protein LWW93_04915 [Hyphomicrobiales bacterium]|nr:hypothetical protein [Hyphomicrobiales bacterium]